MACFKFIPDNQEVRQLIVDYQLKLFTDASLSPQFRIGYGAYLFNFNESPIHVKRFENTSSSQLELQTLIWALLNIPSTHNQVTVYTDSQNIVRLPDRRKQLENMNFVPKNAKQDHLYQLYKRFFSVIDPLNISFIKVKGHQPLKNQSEFDKIFKRVDKAARAALRAELPKPNI